jgi:hypothetical protein
MMERIDNELECSARELLAYLDTESEIEKKLAVYSKQFSLKECGRQFLQRPRERWSLLSDAVYTDTAADKLFICV